MKALAEFQEHLQQSRRIVALVGAGLSVSSGLPTYRGTQGLWKNFNMIDLATPDAFYIDPGLVWQFYSWRRFGALKALPNKGHHAVSQLARLKGNDYITITQNVDGLQTRSGHPKHNLFEIHGSLFELKCTSFTCNYTDKNNYTNPLTAALADTEYEYENTRKRRDLDADHSISPQFRPVKELDESDLPRCPACGGLLRPGVVWFGESLSLQVINRVDNFIEQDHVDLVLVIGTSGTVYPANSYVDRIKSKGGKVAVFNTDIDQDVMEGRVANTWGFKGDAAETLPLALKPLLDQAESRGPEKRESRGEPGDPCC